MKTYYKIGIALSALLIVLPLIIKAQPVKKTLPEFSSIVINVPAEIKLSQGTENYIEAKDSTEFIGLKAEVRDGVLSINGEGLNDIIIYFTNLSRLELASGCNVKTLNPITSEKLTVLLNEAASTVKLNVSVKNLETIIKGVGDIKYEGTADNHNISIQGAGDVKAYELVTKTTAVLINGSGDVKLDASDKLTGTINGAGEIKYSREPASKNIEVNGVGSYGLKNSADSDSDTTSIKIGKGKFLYIDNKNDTLGDDHHEKKFRIYWAGFGLGVNGYLNADNKTAIPTGYDFLELNYPRSVNVSLNCIEKKLPVWKEHINLVTGLGFDFSNYRFEKNYHLLADSDFIAAAYDSVNTYKKTKLYTCYMNVPLLLQFDTRPYGKHNNTIHFSAGIVGGLRLGSHTKQVYFVNSEKNNPKTRDDFNLNPFRYSAMLRVGYGKVDLYATYALSTLFKENEGPMLYPFTVGITLAGL